MTIDDVLRLLAAECYSAGGQGKWAEANGFSPAFVSSVLRKAKPPSSKLLTAIGVKRMRRVTVTYRRVKP